MKRLVFAEILKRLQTSSHLKKYLKVYVGFGALALVLTSVLAVYVAIAGLRLNCIGTAQSLLSLERLLSKPLEDSFLSLKQACFGGLIETLQPNEESEAI